MFCRDFPRHRNVLYPEDKADLAVITGQQLDFFKKRGDSGADGQDGDGSGAPLRGGQTEGGNGENSRRSSPNRRYSSSVAVRGPI